MFTTDKEYEIFMAALRRRYFIWTAPWLEEVQRWNWESHQFSW